MDSLDNPDMKKTFGERLKEARKEAGLTQKELAVKTGISQPTISEAERGDYGGSAHVAALATACGVNALWLAEGRGPKHPSGGNLRRGAATAAGERSNVEEGPRLSGRGYPLISWVQAGMWTEIIDNFAPGDADEWKECTKDLGTAGYCLRVKGDSMTDPSGPYSFPQGMILYVNPDMEARPGDFIIVRRDNKEATFKRLVLVDGEMYLQALNPEWPNRYLKLTEEDTICGVVRQASFDLS
ncbi:LexA family protein [Ralstonia edaphi]|uniref:LexA family protein n=1 Tax=Ralstonia edaphi TaxID=3058599 RepID=UPI002931E984|nr:S24 family peptidase [Ralstonia sp. LMG 6871]